jgi:glycosyltransferase involved in cell wall biosynthesis
MPGVEVSGSVPDVRPFLRQAAVAVAPLRVVHGVQNKVLEAMAMGLPVVGTSKGHAGLEALRGRDLLVEDEPGKFADIVVNLLRNPERRAIVGRAARCFVETHHSWPASMAKLDRLLATFSRRPADPAIRAGELET